MPEGIYDPKFAPDILGNAQYPRLQEQGDNDKIAKDFNNAQKVLWTTTGQFYPPQMLLLMLVFNHYNTCGCGPSIEAKTPEIPVKSEGSK